MERAAGAGPSGPAPAFLQPAARRVVFDTNVLLSLYVFADSRFAPLRARVEVGVWQAITSDACCAEFRRVLGYPLFALTQARQIEALEAYRAHAVPCNQPPAGAIVALPRCADRDDQKFLELARDSRADWLVTADKALLRLARRDKLHGLFHILTPDIALTKT